MAAILALGLRAPDTPCARPGRPAFRHDRAVYGLAWAARPEWFLLACVAQAATYGCASLVWRQALRRAGHPRSLSTLVPLGLHTSSKGSKRLRIKALEAAPLRS